MSQDEEDAAVTIQRFVRGKQARIRVNSLKKLRRVLDELRETEATFAKQLEVVAEVLLPALIGLVASRAGSGSKKHKHQDHCEDHGGHSDAELSDFFSGLYVQVQPLSKTHVHLAKVLRERSESPAQALLHSICTDEIQQGYLKYCVLYDRFTSKVRSAESILDHAKGDAGLMKAYFEALTLAADKHGAETGKKAQWATMELDSFLILPVQRLPRYSMLLAEVDKSVRQLREGFPFHSDREDISKALTAIKAVTDKVNETKREQDQLSDAVKVALAIGQPASWLRLSTLEAVAALARVEGTSASKHHAHVSSGTVSMIDAKEGGRTFVDEIDCDILEAADATHTHESRCRQKTRIFLMSDLLLVTEARKKGFRVTRAIPIKRIVSLDCRGRAVIITEETRTSSYPFLLQQQLWLSQPDDAKIVEQRKSFSLRSFSRTKSGRILADQPAVVNSLNAAMLSFGASSRLVQGLIPFLSGATHVTNSSPDDNELNEMLALRPSLSEAEWEAICRHGDQKAAQQGDVIIRQGQKFAGLFFVMSGDLSVWVSNKDGSSEKQVYTLVKEDFFGELSLVYEKGATASVKVESPEAKLIHVSPVQLLEALSEGEFELCERFFRLVVHAFSVRIFDKAIGETERRKLHKTHLLRDTAQGLHVQQQLKEQLRIREKFEFLAVYNDVEVVQSKSAIAGSCYILSTGVAYVGTAFGVAREEYLPWRKIAEIAETNDVVSITLKKKGKVPLEIKFSDSENARACLRVSTQARDGVKGLQRVSSAEEFPNMAEKEQLPAPSVWELKIKDWDLLNGVAQVQEMPPRDTAVFRAGQAPHPLAVYQITGGRCRMENSDGVVLARLRPGDMFGELTFLFGGKERTTVVALTAHNRSRRQTLPTELDTGNEALKNSPKNSPLQVRRRSGSSAAEAPDGNRSDHVSRRKMALSKAALGSSTRSLSSSAARLPERKPTKALRNDCTHLQVMSKTSLHKLWSSYPRVVVQFYRNVTAQLITRMAATSPDRRNEVASPS